MQLIFNFLKKLNSFYTIGQIISLLFILVRYINWYDGKPHEEKNTNCVRVSLFLLKIGNLNKTLIITRFLYHIHLKYILQP